MKKVISLCLTVVMLLSVTAGLNLTAFAGTPLIYNINVYHANEPAAGARPDFMYQQYDLIGDEGVYYADIDKSANDKTTSEGTSWYDLTAKAWVDPADSTYRFICGHQYQLYVYLSLSGGGQVAFANPNDMDARVNGNVASARESRFNFDDQHLEISRTFPVLAHNLTAVAAKKATPVATGNNAYYQCSVCNECFKDEKGTIPTTVAAETINKTAKWTNPLKVTAKKPTVKFKSLKKKNQTIAAKKAFTVSKAQGKVTYKLNSAKKGKKSYKKYFAINKTTGKITVKKKLPKGTYKVSFKVSAAGTAYYKAGTKNVTVNIKVK